MRPPQSGLSLGMRLLYSSTILSYLACVVNTPAFTIIPILTVWWVTQQRSVLRAGINPEGWRTKLPWDLISSILGGGGDLSSHMAEVIQRSQTRLTNAAF